MDIGFSTLGAPQMTFSEAIETAEKHGLSFLEVRTLGGLLDMPAYFAQNPPPVVHPEVRVLGTSFCLLHTCDTDAIEANAALAQRLGARYLRIFGEGGGSMAPTMSEEQLDLAAANLIHMQALVKDFSVELILETHDIFSSTERILALSSRLADPLKILWDSHHTWFFSGEKLADTWEQLAPLVVHVHYKDSLPDDSPHKHRYVLPGDGAFPTTELRSILEAANYTGGVSLEWEKMWHPEIAELEPALEKFVQLFH